MPKLLRLLLQVVCIATGLCAGFSSHATGWAASPADGAARQFDERVAPILIRRCLECHSGVEPAGKLDLSQRATLQTGGESGPAVVAGKPAESLLWQRVSAKEMPPKKPLAADEQAVLQKWIESGAGWGSGPLDLFRFTTSRRAGYDWWALQPLPASQPPSSTGDSRWPRNAIDNYVLQTLSERGLQPSTEADRHTLIRRLSFDLLGLPPSPEEVAEFVNDSRSDAYERLVDRLLASPHYGVRWARHWLDLARFGESQGFERDKLRENSWPYRDWVVDAFNSDMPYDRFARLQIAGDVLHPDEPAAVIATGFLVAGPFDEVGKNQQSAPMKAVVRQDELEDLASVVGQTFLGLTVNCARCHDHKFDPIRQQEYYQITAALDGVQHGSREVLSAETRRRAAEADGEIKSLREQTKTLNEAVRQRLLATRKDLKEVVDAPTPLARWMFDEDASDAVGQLHGKPQGSALFRDKQLVFDGKSGYVATVPLAADLRAKTLEAWVRLDNLTQRGGGVIGVQSLDGTVFDTLVIGEKQPGHWLAGSDHFRRSQEFQGTAETEATKAAVHVAVVYHADGQIAGYRNGQPYGKPYKSEGPAHFAAGKAQVILGLRHGPAGGNKLLAGAIETAQLYDRALSAEEIAKSFAAESAGLTAADFQAAMTADERARRDEWDRKLAELVAHRATLKPLSTYAVTPAPPGVSHVLLRGNPATKGDAVTPGGIASLKGTSADFGLLPDAADAARRVKLAEWIAGRDNPLFARVLVNRLWHYHFGVGLVDTPNDFGFNGGRPTHPELLDYLAGELVRGGFRLKPLHRLMVTSAAYRQSSRTREQAAAIDADNRLLWRKSPSRLEAESLRDATLTVAGQRNDQMGGPGYRDFTTFVRNTQFYEMQDPVGAEFNRRSLYRTWIRSGRSALLDAFDCPDPSTKTPRRAVTVTPLQALSLLNNSFALRMSDHFADRLRREAGDDPAKQLRRAYQLAYARDPDADELATLVPFLTAHGLPELCRVLLNSNEFLYID